MQVRTRKAACGLFNSVGCSGWIIRLTVEMVWFLAALVQRPLYLVRCNIPLKQSSCGQNLTFELTLQIISMRYVKIVHLVPSTAAFTVLLRGFTKMRFIQV